MPSYQAPQLPKQLIPQTPASPAYKFNAPKSPANTQLLNSMGNIGQDIANLGPVQRGATAIASKLGASPKLANGIGVAATFAAPVGDLEAGTKFMPIERLISHEGTDASRVAEYVSHLKSGGKIDPLKIIPEGLKYGVEDGKHRLEALKQLGHSHAPVQILPSKVHVNYYDTRFLKDKAGKFLGSVGRKLK